MLTIAQRATVKAYILATPELANKTSGTATDYGYIAAALSAAASPTFYVWRTSYSPEQIRAAMTVNLGTAQLDALTAGKRDALLWFIGATINPSDPAVVATLDDFCGSQNTLKASLLNGAKRAATLVEKLLATGTGSLASAATMTYEGGVGIEEVAAILA
jgi:hypothetical protein